MKEDWILRSISTASLLLVQRYHTYTSTWKTQENHHKLSHSTYKDYTSPPRRGVAIGLLGSDKSSSVTPTCCTDVFQLTYHTRLFPGTINVNNPRAGPAVRWSGSGSDVNQHDLSASGRDETWVWLVANEGFHSSLEFHAWPSKVKAWHCSTVI